LINVKVARVAVWDRDDVAPHAGGVD
jgi:hypothetical protein